MRLGTAALVILLLAGAAQAQPFPGAVLVNGGWVPCTHQIAIDVGLGCGSTAPRVGVPATAAFEVGRFYQNPTGTCDFKMLALASTYLHRRPVLVAETVRGRHDACPEVAYFFDPLRVPEPGWRDITETIPPEAR